MRIAHGALRGSRSSAARLAPIALLACAACSSGSSGHAASRGPQIKLRDAGSGAHAAPDNDAAPFANAADAGPSGKAGAGAATQQPSRPGGCVRPGELNEFHLPLCPMADGGGTPDASSPPPMTTTPPGCRRGFDQLGRPICLDDAGIEKPPPPPSCVRGGLCKQLVLAGSGQLDVLFMIDDSGSMSEEQAALVREMPRLIRVLTSGDIDGDGKQEFPAVQDLHLGVVSSDMGLPTGIQGVSGCSGLGNDGLLQHLPAAGMTGCASSYPPFLAYDASHVDPNQAASDFACIATLGTAGCGFEHPLESVLKAITPSTSDLRFLPNAASMPATRGQADGPNAGFLRQDSLVLIVVVTDEDDCSAREPRIFTPPQYLDPNDPLEAEAFNLRCYYNKPQLFDVARYIDGLQAIRPSGSNLVLFAAITGVPQLLVDAAARAKVDFSDAKARDAYYDGLLADPAMQEVVDSTNTNDLVPSCQSANGRAYPPRRIVQVAKGFGENAVVQSICQESFAPALDPVVARISASLTVGCLGQTFTRAADAKIACDVIWELPAPGTPGASLQLCDERSYLMTPDDRDRRTSADGRTRCFVNQVPVLPSDGGAPQPAAGSGWYYDDFSSEATDRCGAATHDRVVFTSDVEAPADVRVYVDCAAP